MSSGKRSKKAKKNREKRRNVRRPSSLAGVRPDKRLGQNFLIDEDVIEAIIDGSGVTKDTLVIEIGPGTGALTLPLAERAGHVIAVELDEDMIKGLRIKTFGMDNVEIINQDILKTDIKGISQAALEKHGLSELRIIGNLPYYITTPIIMKLLDSHTGASSITVMMQKEVADRLMASPGTKTYGAVSVAVQYYSKVNHIIDAPHTSFMPQPKVDSSVLRLDVLDEPLVKVENEKHYFGVVRAAFSQKRKTLLNSLGSTGAPKDVIRNALAASGIEESRRAETLSLQDFAVISEELEKAGY